MGRGELCLRHHLSVANAAAPACLNAQSSHRRLAAGYAERIRILDAVEAPVEAPQQRTPVHDAAVRSRSTADRTHEVPEPGAS